MQTTKRVGNVLYLLYKFWNICMFLSIWTSFGYTLRMGILKVQLSFPWQSFRKSSFFFLLFIHTYIIKIELFQPELMIFRRKKISYKKICGTKNIVLGEKYLFLNNKILTAIPLHSKFKIITFFLFFLQCKTSKCLSWTTENVS